LQNGLNTVNSSLVQACSSLFKHKKLFNEMPDETFYIEKCRKLIEEKLAWGSSKTWQNQDFENLSDKIYEVTNSMISSSTLKRIWGKVRYNSKPNLATLNVLAQFTGYENWRAFTAASVQPVKEDLKDTAPKPALKLSVKWLLIWAAIILFSIVLQSLLQKKHRRLKIGQVSFFSKPVTLGVPNTVIFQYDATNSNADSVFIQQSWDLRRRFKIDKKLHEYTSTYYVPGYYKAKLILNDSIVKEHDVYIETNGWLGLIETKPIPVYLPDSVYENKQQMGISEKVLEDQKIDLSHEPPVFTLTKVDKNIDLPGDRFLLNAELQNTFRDNSKGICKETHIAVLGTEGLIDIPLCKSGCVGAIGILLGMKYISGKTTNLSGFGVDFEKPVKVHCESRDGRIKIVVNGKTGYEGAFSKNIGRIVGFRITFVGTGMLNSFDCRAS
jgi:hypothetical protein